MQRFIVNIFVIEIYSTFDVGLTKPIYVLFLCSQTLIVHYSELCDISEKRHKKIIENMEHLKVQLSSRKSEENLIEALPVRTEDTKNENDEHLKVPPLSLKSEENLIEIPPIKIEEIKIEITPTNSTSSFLSDLEQKSLSKSLSVDTFSTCESDLVSTPNEIHSSSSMDILNANLDQQKDGINENFLIAEENFKAALRNKAKVMSLELGIETKVVPKARTKYGLHDDGLLTEAQRNKLRVMSSEFGIEIGDDVKKDLHLQEKKKTQIEMNKEKMMASNECFYNRSYDNVNFVNQNIPEAGETEIRNNNKKLSLILEKPDLDIQKPTPMSIDSTPLSEIVSTPSTNQFFQQPPSTAATNFTDEGFDFHVDTTQKSISSFTEKSTIISKISKRVSQEETKSIQPNCLHLFLQQSVSLPLTVQTKLINQELLKFFINDLQYLKHLMSLRDYFLLQDGEFGRNITEGLFEKLYDVNFPVELINCRTLQFLVHKALNSSSKCQNNSDCLSFEINNLPKSFNLGDLKVLDCLSLSYKVDWPLNIILPADTIKKYDEVFKYLLQLHRVSWVQKKTFEVVINFNN